LVCVFKLSPVIAGYVFVCCLPFSPRIAGPSISVLTLLDALDAAGLPVAIQDAVGVAIGDASEVPLSSVKSLLTGAGVGVAAAMRIVGRLVSVWRCMVR
jgi:hypothetical protein